MGSASCSLHRAETFSERSTSLADTDRCSRKHPTPDGFSLTCTVSSHGRGSDVKKRKSRPVRDLCVLLSSVWNLTGKRKKERLSSLSISCVKDGSANANPQSTHPPVIAYRTPTVCVSNWEFCGVRAYHLYFCVFARTRVCVSMLGFKGKMCV